MLNILLTYCFIRTKVKLRVWAWAIFCYITFTQFGISTLGAWDTENMATEAQRKLFNNISPEMRGSVARDVMSEYRRWVLGQIAAASRSNAGSARMEELTELKDRLATEFSAVIRGDEGVINRALTEYRPFLAEINKGRTPQSNNSGGVNGGPV